MYIVKERWTNKKVNILSEESKFITPVDCMNYIDSIMDAKQECIREFLGDFPKHNTTTIPRKNKKNYYHKVIIDKKELPNTYMEIWYEKEV